MTTHTPGPWVVRYGKQRQPVGIDAPRDTGIPGAVGCVVRQNGIGLPSSEMAQANARLIAAAPDMLAALKVALDNCMLDREPAEIVEAAIAKAEGA